MRSLLATHSSDVLNLATGGTFTRSTEGSYLIAAPTDGSSAFLVWAGVNARRIENRGDGLGDMLLMEGSRTNFVLQSRAIKTTPWAAIGAGATAATEDFGNGPDGTQVADRVNVDAAHYSWSQDLTGLMTNPHVLTGFGKANSGTPDWRPTYSAAAAWSGVITSTWVRKEKKTATTGSRLYAEDGTTGGGAADVLVDLWQAENGYFPSSPIRTTTAAVTRGADVLSYAVGQYPASFLDRGFLFTFAPDCTSAEHIAAGVSMRIASVASGTNVVQFVAGAATLRLYCGGAIVCTSGALTWSRGQLLTITVEPLAGRLTVAGASSGNGTFSGTGAAWPSSAYSPSSDQTAFGRFGMKVVAL